jgi:hypothetical protein
MKQQEKQQGKAGATSAPGDGQQEVDFKKLSISDAFSLLNVSYVWRMEAPDLC